MLRTKDALDRHINVVHLELKKFQCPDCKNKFATKADLKKHVKSSHDEERNVLVTCDFCNEKFRRAYLKRHIYYKHVDCKLSKTCDKCGKDFKTREIMLKHVRNIH